MDEAAGALSAGGRFRNVEEALARIERKLDRKADRDEVVKMESRMFALENGSAPLARVFINQQEGLLKRLDAIEDLGSMQAREAVALAHEVDKKVDVLQREAYERAALIRRDAADQTSRYNGYIVLLGIVGAGNALLNMLQLAGVIHP